MYRVLQEALSNIAKHSHANHASVRLAYEDGAACLYIADSGVGFDAPHLASEGLGLVSMRERVNLLKGQLVIHSAAGRGTRIGVKLPLARSSQEQPASSFSKSA
jgi:signal transduction histidine kinase